MNAVTTTTVVGTTGDESLIGGVGDDVLSSGGGRDTLSGGGGNDRVVGASGAETLEGGVGNDYLAGGSGTDRLTGGTGLDVFAFDTAADAANVDRITDFNAADDTIWLENAVFRGLADGQLQAAAFQTGSRALDSSDRVIYDSATGSLYFDSDGTGAAAQVEFARLSTGLRLSAADFYVV